MSQQTQPSDDSDPKQPTRSRAEWVTFSLASLVLAIVVGLVGYTWLDEQQQQPPLLSVNTERIRVAEGQFYVPFTVTNSGGETAESVQVAAELRINGAIAEAADLEIDFLSNGEKAEGAFVFSRDPKQGQLTVRVASYRLP